jgi:hypothetical protein
MSEFELFRGWEERKVLTQIHSNLMAALIDDDNDNVVGSVSSSSFAIGGRYFAEVDLEEELHVNRTASTEQETTMDDEAEAGNGSTVMQA